MAATSERVNEVSGQLFCFRFSGRGPMAWQIRCRSALLDSAKPRRPHSQTHANLQGQRVFLRVEYTRPRSDRASWAKVAQRIGGSCRRRLHEGDFNSNSPIPSRSPFSLNQIPEMPRQRPSKKVHMWAAAKARVLQGFRGKNDSHRISRKKISIRISLIDFQNRFEKDSSLFPHLHHGGSQNGSPDYRTAASNLSLGSNAGGNNNNNNIRNKGGYHHPGTLPSIWQAAKKHQQQMQMRPSLLPYLNLWNWMIEREDTLNIQPCFILTDFDALQTTIHWTIEKEKIH